MYLTKYFSKKQIINNLAKYETYYQVALGILISSTIFWTSFGGAGVNFITAMDTIKFNNIAILPKPSGEIPNHHSLLSGRTASNQPSLYLSI